MDAFGWLVLQQFMGCPTRITIAFQHTVVVSEYTTTSIQYTIRFVAIPRSSITLPFHFYEKPGLLAYCHYEKLNLVHVILTHSHSLRHPHISNPVVRICPTQSFAHFTSLLFFLRFPLYCSCYSSTSP